MTNFLEQKHCLDNYTKIESGGIDITHLCKFNFIQKSVTISSLNIVENKICIITTSPSDTSILNDNMSVLIKSFEEKTRKDKLSRKGKSTYGPQRDR